MRTTTADISSLVKRIESREIRLPEIQRGYVWKPAQIAGLLDSLYRRYPSGSLLLWETDAPISERSVATDGPHGKPMARPQYLLDGQQRLTSLHRVFTGHERARVVFNVETERFQIESVATKKDPRWIAVGPLLSEETESFELVTALKEQLPNLDTKAVGKRLQGIEAIRGYPYFIEILENLEYEVVAEIFVRVNSRGRNLRTTDLALATLSARWPGTVQRFELEAAWCADVGYRHLNFTFLTRCLAAFASETTSLGDFAKVSDEVLERSWDQMHRGLEHVIKLLQGSADIATSELLPSVNALIPLVVYLGSRDDLPMKPDEANALLYWLFGAFVLARYSVSATTVIAQDVAAVRSGDPIARLYQNLGLIGQRLLVTEEMLAGRGAGSPYFLLSYLTARRAKATDWWHGVPICTDASGGYAVEYHHIHPRGTLKGQYSKAEINDLANLAFISGKANRKISSRSPAKYFEELSDEELSSHFVPLDPSLRTPSAYPAFIRERRRLLATAMTDLLDSFQPEMLQAAEGKAADPTEGETLVLAAYGSAQDAVDAVLFVSATANGQEWSASLPLADLRQFIQDLENGLAGDLVVAGEEIAVAAGSDPIEIPFGPLLTSGSLEEWRKVLDRECGDLTAPAEAPPAPTPKAWSGDRRFFPILDSE